MSGEFACRLCGSVIVWAQGIRWVRDQGRFVDQRHLIRADNGLHSNICPASTASDPVHVIDDNPLLCAFSLGRGIYCGRPARHGRTDGPVARHATPPTTQPRTPAGSTEETP